MPAAIRSDIVVLGTTLGALVASAYLARSGLRVIVLEEETQSRRPLLLREPFALQGLESEGPVERVLAEIGVPLGERREIRADRLSVQVALPDARVDLGEGIDRLASELELLEVARAAESREWLLQLEARGAEQRAALIKSAGAPGRPRRWSARETRGPRLAPPPDGLGPISRALCSALAPVDPARPPPASVVGRLLSRGGFSMPHAGRPFLDLFRRRIEALHGEIRPARAFDLIADRDEMGVDLGHERVFGRALVVGVAREPLARFLAERSGPRGGGAPRWLRGAPAPARVPLQLLRAERAALPVGMDHRLVDASRESEGDGAALLRWIQRSRDPSDGTLEWVVMRGPGAAYRAHDPEKEPLDALAPFAADQITPIDPGPFPAWDLDAADLRFPEPFGPSVLRRRPLIAAVGPEVAPIGGVESEILTARRTAIRLAERLDAPRRAA